MKRALLCLFLVACSSGPSAPHPKPVESSAGNAPPLPTQDAGATVVDPPPDAGAPADDAAPAACNDLALNGQPVAEVARSGNRPDAVGGAIPAGTYVLIERDFFPDSAEEGAALDPSAVASTVVFDGTAMKAITGTDGAAPELSASTYAVFDTILSSTESCPVRNETTNRFFSAQGTQIWFFPDKTRRWVYSSK